MRQFHTNKDSVTEICCLWSSDARKNEKPTQFVRNYVGFCEWAFHKSKSNTQRKNLCSFCKIAKEHQLKAESCLAANALYLTSGDFIEKTTSFDTAVIVGEMHWTAQVLFIFTLISYE